MQLGKNQLIYTSASMTSSLVDILKSVETNLAISLDQIQSVWTKFNLDQIQPAESLKSIKINLAASLDQIQSPWTKFSLDQIQLTEFLKMLKAKSLVKMCS